MELAFPIPIVSGIQDSLSCIPDSRARIPEIPGNPVSFARGECIDKIRTQEVSRAGNWHIRC